MSLVETLYLLAKKKAVITTAFHFMEKTRLVNYQFTHHLFVSVFYFQHIDARLYRIQLNVLVDKTGVFIGGLVYRSATQINQF